MEQAEDDTGLVLGFCCVNKNKSVPACSIREEGCSQCCRGKAPFSNKVFLYFGLT